MKNNKIAIVFVAMMLALMFTSVGSANVNGLSNDSLNSEIDSILSSGKNVFLFFHADGCHFCQQQKPIIDELEQEYDENIAFFHIDCEEHPKVMEDFGVDVYPAMFLIMGKREDGQYESQYFRGFTDKETLKTSMDWIITNGSITENSMRLPLRLFGASPTLLNDDEMHIVALASAASDPPEASVCPSSPPGIAPQDPNILSRSLCRGACGPDCPSTCKDLDDISICVFDGERDFVCKYTVIECGSHKGCVEHDKCYDSFAGVLLPAFRRVCDMRCIWNYNITMCNSWRVGGGPYVSMLMFSGPPKPTACQAPHCYGFDHIIGEECINGECVTKIVDCSEHDRVYCDNNMVMFDDYYCDDESPTMCSHEKKILDNCSAGGGYCMDLTKSCWHPLDIPQLPNVPEPPKIPNIPIPHIP